MSWSRPGKRSKQVDAAVLTPRRLLALVITVMVAGSLLVNPVLAAPPGAPQNVQATAGLNQIELSWDPPLDDGGLAVTDYKIYSGTTSGDLTLLTTVTALTTTYTHTGLGDGDTRYYEIVAVNLDGDGTPSEEVSATTHDVPGAPQSLLLTPGVGQVALSWDPPLDNGGSAVTLYHVYRGTDESSLVKIADTADTSYTDTGLGDGVMRFYAVSAENAVGEGPQTDAQATVTLDTADAPRNLVATPSVGQIALTWDPPLDDGGSALTGYKVLSGTTSGDLSLLTSVDETTTSYTHTGLGAGETRFYQVVAVNLVGDSSPTSEVSATTPMLPDAPSDLAASAGSGNITLTWDEPVSHGGDPVTGYEVYGADAADGPYTLLASVGADVFTYTEEGLGNGVTRHYRVNATNGVGEGPGASASATTPAPSGGGGGGGGGWFRSSYDVTARSVWSSDADASYRFGPVNLAAGAEVTATFPGGDFLLERIDLKFKDQHQGVTLDVDLLPGPADAIALGSDDGFAALQHFRFTLRDSHGPLGHEALESVVLVLSPNAQWLQEHPAALVMLRFDPEASQWVPQSSELVAEDGKHVLKVTVPGFSEFALAADEQAPTITFPAGLDEHDPMDPLVVNVTDNRDVLLVQFHLDNEELEVEFDGNNATHTPSAPLEPGEYVFTVTAVDESGLIATENRTLTVSGQEGAAEDPESQEDDEEKKRSPMPAVILVLLAVFVLVGIVSGLMLRSSKKQE